jgi:hypothetical protein
VRSKTGRRQPEQKAGWYNKPGVDQDVAGEVPLLIDNHVSMPDKKEAHRDKDQQDLPGSFPTPTFTLILKHFSMMWRLFGGSDLSHDCSDEGKDRAESAHAHEVKKGFEVHQYYDVAKAEKTSAKDVFDSKAKAQTLAVEDPLMQTVKINGKGVPLASQGVRRYGLDAFVHGESDGHVPIHRVNGDKAKSNLHAQHTSIPRRRTDQVMELHVVHGNVRMDTFGPQDSCASRLVIAVQQVHIAISLQNLSILIFVSCYYSETCSTHGVCRVHHIHMLHVMYVCLQMEIHDCLETSPFHKFMCYYDMPESRRQLHSSMFRCELLSVRPDPVRLPDREEYRLKVMTFHAKDFMCQMPYCSH